MPSINFGRDKSSTRRLSRRLRRFRTSKVTEESDMNAGTDLAKAQQELQRAQRERAEVQKMRPKTDENAWRARRLIAENNFANRIRGTFSS